MEQINAVIQWEEVGLSIVSDRNAALNKAIIAYVVDNKTGKFLEKISFTPKTPVEAEISHWPKYFADTINQQGKQIRAGIKNNNDEFNTEESLDANKLWKPVGQDIRIFTMSDSLKNWQDSGQVITTMYIVPSIKITMEVIDSQGFNVIHESLEFSTPSDQTDKKKLLYQLGNYINENSDFVRVGEPIGSGSNIFEPSKRLKKQKLWIPMGSELILNFDYTYAEEVKIESYAYDALGRERSSYSYDWNNSGNNERKKLFSIGAKAFYGQWDSVRRQFNDGTEEREIFNPITLTQEVTRGIVAEDTSFQRRSKIVTKYDKNGNPTEATRFDSNNHSFGQIKEAYDGWDNLREEIDERGNKTTYEYDAFNREIKRVLPDNSSLKKRHAPYTEDALLISCSLTASGKTVSLGRQEFDGLLRKKKREVGGRTETFTYVGKGPKPANIEYTDGSYVSYSYIPELDYGIHQVKAEYSKGRGTIQQDFTWDSNLRLVKDYKTNQGSTCSFKYTPSGKLIRETYNSVAQAGFSWSLRGRELTFLDVKGAKTNYSYDDIGRLVKIDDEKIEVSFSYDIQNNKIQQTSRNKSAAQETLEIVVFYDGFGWERIRNIAFFDSKANYESDPKKAVYTATVAQTYNNNGQLAIRKTQLKGKDIRTEGYFYDVRNRLQTYICAGVQLPKDGYGNAILHQSFTYDPMDNMTQYVTKLADGTVNKVTFFYENAKDPTQLSRLTNTHKGYYPEIKLEYDANGRMTQNEKGATFIYNSLGRLSLVLSPGKKEGVVYQYDANNRLCKIIESLGGGLPLTRELYYHNNRLSNESLRRTKGATTDESFREYRHVKHGSTNIAIVSDQDGGVVTQMATDAQDTVVLGVEGVGPEASDVKLKSYTPWGLLFDSSIDPATVDSRFPLFNGEEYDPFTRSYHLGNGYRAYNPGLMRFTCPDSLTILDGGSINPYAYCENDPINRTDPSGHLSGWAWTGIAFGVGGLLVGSLAFAGIAAGIAAGTGFSILSLALTTLAVSSATLSILSGALEEVDPAVSEWLGWASIITGIAGFRWDSIPSVAKYSITATLKIIGNRVVSVPVAKVSRFKYAMSYFDVVGMAATTVGMIATGDIRQKYKSTYSSEESAGSAEDFMLGKIPKGPKGLKGLKAPGRILIPGI